MTDKIAGPSSWPVDELGDETSELLPKRQFHRVDRPATAIPLTYAAAGLSAPPRAEQHTGARAGVTFVGREAARRRAQGGSIDTPVSFRADQFVGESL
jgi:hypothetical protein